MWDFWLYVILRNEENARRNGTLPVVEKLTMGPKFFILTMMATERRQNVPPAE